MIGKTNKNPSLFEQPLSEMINLKTPIYALSQKIDWDFIKKELSPLYSKRGRPAHPIRLMAGLLILKSLRNLSDEVLVDEQWEENIYYQYFCGFEYAQKKQALIAVHDSTNGNKKNRKKQEVVYADTTVQDKNITLHQFSKEIAEKKWKEKLIGKSVAVGKIGDNDILLNTKNLKSGLTKGDWKNSYFRNLLYLDIEEVLKETKFDKKLHNDLKGRPFQYYYGTVEVMGDNYWVRLKRNVNTKEIDLYYIDGNKPQTI